MISVFKAYWEGIRETWILKKLIILIYLIQFLFAYLMTMPISSMLDKAFSSSTISQHILKEFDIIAFTSFYSDFLSNINFARISIIYTIIYLLINTFFAGGIIWMYVTKSRFNISEFFNRCLLYFPRFLTLFAVSILYFGTALILYSLLGKIFNLFTENSISEELPIFLFIVKILILGVFFALINMILDYAKIITVSDEKDKMLFVTFDSLKFIMMNMLSTTGLFSLYLFSGFLLLAIYLLLESLLHVQSMGGVILFFVLTQIYVFLRNWIRLAFFGGQTIFYQHSMTAMPGMLTKEMMDNAVDEYEKKVAENEDSE